MPDRLRLLLLLTAAPAALLLHSSPAQAQIRRCTDAHGNSVYTDRDCASAGGVDRLPRGAAPAAAQQTPYTGGCARNLRDLVGQITSAIDAHDGNKLASVYHWTGMSDDRAYAVIERLDAIAQRPLLDIAPVMPSVAEPEATPGAWTTLPPAAPNAALAPLPPITPSAPAGLGRPAGMSGEQAPQAAPDAETTAQTAAAPAPVPHRRAPVALRLEQTLGNGVTPSRTVFGLTRHYGCWWIKG
ncbi:hypothetical protein AZ78_1932 [Lysobacter capsici AZ78]|uniref:DUF4124 domain-containing protein n=1 Tax=Lysobacter capsici AZ78 TaxID=1444315 RepID=A0A125MMT2_9GAMM|nr:hypothetical protein [Lysobacter capsici]KWS04383.1 hypothetical protein AZ78_1932 [Lysobacter capsici AZ78]